MNYFVIESTFNDPLPVGSEKLQELIREHQQYLHAGFAGGWILMSGPKASSGGGVIMMKGPSLREVEAYFRADPMKTAGVQEYRVIEFALHDCQPAVREWFKG